VLENRVLRRIFGPKRDAVTGSLRKLPGIIIVMQLSMGRACRKNVGEEEFI
jgi:hypothetical protein